MVDEARATRLLHGVTEILVNLRDDASRDRDALLADGLALDAIKYRFVTAIEGCLDVAQHLCASEGWGPPKTNADAMLVLGRHEVLDRDLAATMARAVGFRNLLVHQYADVDNAIVVGHLDDLGDLQGFVMAVAAWVESQRTE